MTGSEVAANPNQVSHWFESGVGGEIRHTTLTFDITSLLGLGDLLSATLNFNVLSVWGGGWAGTLVEPIHVGDGPGLRSFDVTTILNDLVAAGSTSAVFGSSPAPYAGFTFGSAEGGDPAFLSVTAAAGNGGDAGGGGNVVPEPGSLLLAALGLLALARSRGKAAA